MPTYGDGRHELGQNFLNDRRTIERVVELTARTHGPIIEIGSGTGALTIPLETLRRPLTGIEIDGRLADRVRRRTGGGTRIVHGDFLRHQLPSEPHVLVGNLPFHLTTALLRRLLHSGHWTDAVLILQWEVARRRAGIGGATMMTAQWWPWFEFTLDRRVPSTAFRPRPGVDGGLLRIERRHRPLVPDEQRAAYRDLVHTIFTGRGRGIREIAGRAAGRGARRPVDLWLGEHDIRPTALPRELTALQWASLFDAIG